MRKLVQQISDMLVALTLAAIVVVIVFLFVAAFHNEPDAQSVIARSASPVRSDGRITWEEWKLKAHLSPEQAAAIDPY